MKSSLEYRLTNAEKAVDRILNPYHDESMIIFVFKDLGETHDQKFAEKEKELGCKINRNKVMFFCISGITKL